MDLSSQSLAPPAPTTYHHQWQLRPLHGLAESHRLGLAPPPPLRPPHRNCPSCYDLDEVPPTEEQPSRPDEIHVDHVSFVVLIGRTLAELRNTASTGCQVCSLLLKVVRYFGLDMDGASETRNIVVRLPIGPGSIEVSFPRRGIEVIAQLFTPFSEGKMWGRIRPLKGVATDHLSNDSMIFIRSCMRMCVENHVSCFNIPGELPARLIDVGEFNDTIVRLVPCATWSFRPEYIALSYCWGNAVTMTTTSANIEQHQAGIDMAALPRAYVDAILMVREMGSRYLWVDALCIIQDSLQDWETETARMGGIFAGAQLTLAASMTNMASLPFLKRDGPLPSMPPDMFSEWMDENGSSTLVQARLVPEVGVHRKWSDNSDPRTSVELLSRRAWTLQERVASTRLLSVTDTELQWICQEAIMCECRSRLNHRREFGFTPLHRITKHDEAFNFWHKAVENYTKRTLSYPQDKLPAISAIATLVHQKTGSSYAAGLWLNNIHLDLLWRRCSPIKGPPSPEATAPTFSWASIDGEVDYYCFRNGKEPFQRSASVTEMVTTPSPNAPFGRVGNGYIKVQGSLVPGFVEKSFDDGWMVVRLGETRKELYSDTRLGHFSSQDADGTWQKYACRLVAVSDSEKQASSLENHEDEPRRCWGLRVGSFQARNAPPTSHELLLLGKPRRNPDAYERIGLASLEGVDEEVLFRPEYLSTITIV